jgi:hypothetical protein
MQAIYYIIILISIIMFLTALIMYIFLYWKREYFDYSKNLICQFKIDRNEVIVNGSNKIKYFQGDTFFKDIGVNIDEIISFYETNNQKKRSVAKNYLVHSKKRRKIISDMFGSCPNEYAILISLTASNENSVWFKISPSLLYSRGRINSAISWRNHYSFDSFCQKSEESFSPGKTIAITIKCNYELTEFNRFFPSLVRDLEIKNLTSLSKKLPVKRKYYYVSNQENGVFLQIFLGQKQIKKYEKILSMVKKYAIKKKFFINNWEMDTGFSIGVKERIFDSKIKKNHVKKMLHESSYNCNYPIRSFYLTQENKEYRSLIENNVEPVMSTRLDSESNFEIDFSPIYDRDMNIIAWLPLVFLAKLNKKVSLSNFIEIAFLYKNEIEEVKLALNKFVEKSMTFYNGTPIIFPIPFGFESYWLSLNRGYSNNKNFVHSNYWICLMKFKNTRIDSMEYGFDFYDRYNLSYGIITSEINYLEYIVKNYGVKHVIYDNYIKSNAIIDLGSAVKIENLITNSNQIKIIFNSISKTEHVQFLKKFGVCYFQGEALAKSSSTNYQ